MKLNQYYTENIYGDILVKNLSIPSPKIALDLGFGSGSLLHAAKRRWGDLSLIGIDIDSRNLVNANSLKLIQTIELNGFNPLLPDIIKERFGDIDLLVCNPPYYSRELDRDAKTILNSVGMLEHIPTYTKKIPAELVFVAQNLRLLSRTGEIGIIVPAGLISGEKWKPIRKFLFSNYCISNVIQLPTCSFRNTDAQTFILTIKHKTQIRENILLSHVQELTQLNINIQEAAVRADYTYYQETSKLENPTYISFSDFDLYRGNKSHNELIKIANKHLHTTNMPSLCAKRRFPNEPLIGAKNTKKGDILIARVGRRCLGRVVYVEKGNIPISDCIIGIRPKTTQLGKAIWEMLSSFQCRNYLNQVSLGVSAKYITYKTITEYLTNNQNVAS